MPGLTHAARFNPDEVREVMARYELGQVTAVRELHAGSSDAPKALVECARGRFVLKRHAPGRDHPLVVAVAHELQLRLTRAGVPVARLIATRDDKNSMVQLDSAVYELTTLVDGTAYERTPAQAFGTGAVLAAAHQAWQGFEPGFATLPERDPTRPLIEAALTGRETDVASALLEIERRADEVLAGLAFDEAPTLLHGDIHPGNLLFHDNEVAALFDFDGVQRGPALHDVAQGASQFSLIKQPGNADEWPDEADLPLANAFVRGYFSVSTDPAPPASAWPWLMAEALVVEAVRSTLPAPILGAVVRKASWLADHADEAAETVAEIA